MKRKGFTLVELLIVILVMGALSASMTLVSSKATGAAKAANVMNNLKIMKDAAFLFYLTTQEGSLFYKREMNCA